jgi:hypothetical protein
MPWNRRPLRELSKGDLVAHCGLWRIVTSTPEPVNIGHHGKPVTALRLSLNGSPLITPTETTVWVTTSRCLPCPPHGPATQAELADLRKALARLDGTDPDLDPVAYDHAIDHVIDSARALVAHGKHIA